MFNGQVKIIQFIATFLEIHHLHHHVQPHHLHHPAQEYISGHVRTTVGIVLLVITLSGVAVMALLR